MLVVLFAVTGLVGFELGWFSDSEAAPPPTPIQPDTAVDVEPPIQPPIQAPLEPAEVDPKLAQPPSEPEAPPESATETGDAIEAEASETGEAIEAVTPEPAAPEKRGWCHLHEDHFTLLERSSKRRASLINAGLCYVCRAEHRKSRTRNFSPRDCAGYSLCGPAASGECG